MKTIDLTVRVAADTVQSLQRAAGAMEMTIGELLDLLAVQRMADTPEKAALLMGEYIMLYAARLSDEEYQKSLQLLQKLMTEELDPEEYLNGELTV